MAGEHPGPAGAVKDQERDSPRGLSAEVARSLPSTDLRPASWAVRPGPRKSRAERWEFLVSRVSRRDRSGLVT